ncbi:hypothetical protein MHBO_004439 [Bonamia ostreae]|uniref:Uncharacterized protein n=1 Tax=Bonamia ostreae TaxID=126728 RepID=A0ABV2ATC1_9EUKA
MQFDKGKLTIIKGDSEAFKVSVMDKETQTLRPFIDGDKIYFTIKKRINTAEKILQKVITTFDEGIAVVELTPEDTANILVDDYIYDIQVNFANGTIKTIAKNKFEVDGGVTYE